MYTVEDLLNRLTKPGIHLKSSPKIKDKLTRIVDGGKSSFVVISDFDGTISKYRWEGKTVPSSFGALRNPSIINEFYVKSSLDVVKKYCVIPKDDKLAEASKIALMVEWSDKEIDLIVQHQFSKDIVQAAAQKSSIKLKDRTHLLIEHLQNYDIPLIVFSAGLGDIVSLTLQRDNLMSDTTHVVSNFLKFDEEGLVIGFENDVIHVMNKNSSALSVHNKLIKERENILLLGDSFYDATMVDDDGSSNILRIGFLNEYDDNRLEKYLQVFDIVLIEDETMDIPLAIVQLFDNKA